VGGTGKTPMVEYLVENLRKNHQVATLSRGYGRKTKGFRLAGAEDSAQTLGDEPFQYYHKWKGAVPVTVGEERALAIPSLLAEKPATEIIILDDAFQHRKVKPQFQILLTTFKRPFWKDKVMPAGLLRESPKGAKRADMLVITKCPNHLDTNQKEKYRNKALKFLNEGTPVLFSSVNYQAPVQLFPKPDSKLGKGSPVILVSGLANSKPLEKYVAANFNLLTHHKYSDHHRYTESNIQGLLDAYLAATSKYPVVNIITSEKDAMRLLDPEHTPLLENLPLWYIPIDIRFSKEDEDTLGNYLNQLLTTRPQV
jgi:tetraacyldisaccharide 4'-kinase